MRRRLFKIIQIGSREDFISRAFDYIIVAMIFLNILSLFLETFEQLSPIFPLLKVVEIFTLSVFCVEYALRIITADYLYPEVSRGRAIVKFIFSFDGIVDLLTIVPFFFFSGFVMFRMLRVVRIFRLFRINSQYDSFNIITSVLKTKRNQIISSVFIIMILMLASSLGMYSAEHEAQPEAFANAFSGIWWSMSTLLTVGYGDIYPITFAGRVMGICIAFLGVGAVAIPTGIISAGFVEQYSKNEHSDVMLHDIKEIGEILATKESGYVGLTIPELSKRYDMRVYMILRGELTIVATDRVKIESGDIIIAKSERMVKSAPKKRGK
ncbi:MAG: ion transporter [Oscillospiraceae bacterium]